MATFNKFNQFVQDLAEKVHNLSSDSASVYLANVAPDSALDAIKTDLAEIATGGGYGGPLDSQNTGAEAAGVYTLTGTAVAITATAGGVATFRYVVLFNDTPTSPVDPLIGWWDYGGSGVTLLEGETFTVKFNGSATTGTILTIQ